MVENSRVNYFTMLVLPSLFTHKLQPTDHTFMYSFSFVKNINLEKLIKSHPGRVVTTRKILKLFRQAYSNLQLMVFEYVKFTHLIEIFLKMKIFLLLIVTVQLLAAESTLPAPAESTPKFDEVVQMFPTISTEVSTPLFFRK